MLNVLETVLWLTLNVYHEARSEDQFGQMAVAHVTMNRSNAKMQPIKEIVLAPKQFSWTHLKKNYIPNDLHAFQVCLQSVLVASQGFDFTMGSTFYHHRDIHPYWADSYTYVAQFGAHKFYRR